MYGQMLNGRRKIIPPHNQHTRSGDKKWRRQVAAALTYRCRRSHQLGPCSWRTRPGG